MNDQRLIEALPFAIFLMSEVIEECNERACQLLACPRQDIIGRSLADFSPAVQPDGRASARATQQHINLALTGQPQLLCWQNRRRDGVLIDVEISMNAIEEAGRNIVLVCLRDIVAGRELEQSLRKCEKRFHALAEVSPVGIFHTDAQGVFQYVNERWCQITGLSRQEAIAKGLACGLHPEDRDWVLQAWCDAAEQNIPFRAEYRIIHAEGKVSSVYGQMVAEKEDSGELVGYVGTITDISERKQIEKELKERNEFIETIMDNLPAGLAVWTWDRGKVLYMNHSYVELLGWPKEAISSVDEFFAHCVPDRQSAKDLLARMDADWASGDLKRMVWEFPIVKPSGEVVDIVNFDIPMFERNLVISFFLDISERKRAEREILKLNQGLEARVIERTRELELANHEMEAFTYSVSHDLRAPLRAIDGFSAALLEDYTDKLDEEGKTYLRYLQEGSRDMSALIDGLLKLSRSTRGGLLKERIDLSAMVKAVVADLHHGEPQQRMVVRVAEGMAADADPRLFKVVLENLLGNAWKYSNLKADPCIEVGCAEQGGEAVYFVKDNGAGFDMAYADKLFLPFQRLHRADEFSGTGIGLATVERIIHHHGGRIWAEASVGEGACFYFTLEPERSSHG